VKKHRGTIQVSSKAGDTRFQVWIPLAEGPGKGCDSADPKAH
jgi:nitrogen-specific signal transduction histidine kinase